MSQIILEQLQYITRVKNHYDNFLKLDASMDAAQCKVRIKNLNSIWCKIEDNHAKLYTSPDFASLQSQPYIKDNVFEATENIYLNTLGRYQKYLDEHPPPPAHLILDSTANAAGPLVHQALRAEICEKLPRLDLPKFSGDFTEWEGFRDIIESAVVNRSDVSQVSKLRLLKMSLIGEAASIIAKFPIKNASFDEVWNKLKFRYDNMRRLVHAHINSIFSISPITKSSSLELKRVYNSITTPIALLKNLKRPVEFWDDILVFHVLALLDLDTKRNWELYFTTMSLTISANPKSTAPSNTVLSSSHIEETDTNTIDTNTSREPPTFDTLLKFIESQITMLESIEESGVHINNSSNTTNNSRYRNQNVSTESAKIFHSKVENSGSSKNTECIICKGPHHFAQCSTFKSKSIQERIEYVKSQKRCFNCLGKHFSNDCPSSKRCSVCGKKHNTSLHLTKSKTSTSQPSHTAATSSSNDQTGTGGS